jgi:hypothetical protein
MADMPVHPFLLQLTQDRALLTAIIARLSSSLINEPLHRFRLSKKSKQMSFALKLRKYANRGISARLDPGHWPQEVTRRP